jgi:protein-tyrosine phosphatase
MASSPALSDLHAEALVRPGTPLRLESMFNLRDLGGYQTIDGRRTRTGRVFRADSLANLTESDLAHVEGLALSLVCDLRRQEEVEKLPDRLPPGVRYDHNPMIMDVNVMGDYRLPDYDWSRFRLESLYIHMLDHSGGTFRRVFEHLAEGEAYPFLFHCAAGKDRTGMVAALLLRTAGVADETVAADFALSDVHIQPKIPEFRERMQKNGANWNGAEKLFGAPAEAMAAALAHLDAGYGTTRGYLEAVGVPDAHVDAFLAVFVE